MRKFLIVLLILIGLLLLAVPAVVGMQAETRYEVLINQLTQGGFQVVRHDYRRGWFGATAETDLELPIPQISDDPAQPAPQPKPVRFTLRSDIAHGPFATQGMSGEQLVIDTQILSGGKPLFPAGYPALIQTRVGLDGNGRTLIDLPAIDLPAREGHPAIQFQGAKGEIGFRADYGRLTVDLALPRLHVDNGQLARFELEGVSLKGDYERGIEGLMLGDVAARVERIGVSSVAQETGRVEVRNLGVTADSTAEGELVKGGLRYTLDSFEVDGNPFGPAEVDVRFSNLSAVALGQIQQSMDELAGQRLPPEQQGMVVMGTMLSNGPEFLKRDPRFAIERLHVRTPKGVIEGRFQIQPVGLEWAEIGNMAVLLEKLEAEAELQMPEQLFLAMFAQQARQAISMQIEQQRMLGEQVEEPDPEQLELQIAALASQQLDGLLQQEVLVRTGEDVATVASLRSGLLTVNGKTLPLPILAPPPAH